MRVGLTGYYRKFIKHVIISWSLNTLLKKGATIVWTDAIKTTFKP
jgi:hypothetical protein